VTRSRAASLTVMATILIAGAIGVASAPLPAACCSGLCDSDGREIKRYAEHPTRCGRSTASGGLAAPRCRGLVLPWHGLDTQGLTNEYMATARSFFERALALDPENIEALVGAAGTELNRGATFVGGDRAARLAAAEVGLIRALSMAPEHPLAHVYLGAVQIFTNRATPGVYECERGLALDRNLANAHAWIGLAKLYMGRGQETEAISARPFASPRAIPSLSAG
jgi:hypothetical protein